jgi:hypothetical protein
VWLWQSIAAGAKAVVYWCANGRSDGYEAGEWDLLDYRGRPTARLGAISRTIETLAPQLPLLATAKPPRADVGIVVSEESMVLDLVEGHGEDPANPRNRQKTADAITGAYLMAADLSLEVAFYDLRRLREADPDSLPPVLLLPGLVVVDAETIELLRSLAAGGRLLVADGFFAWKDRHGRLAADLAPGAARLWGADCVGYEALPERGELIGPRLQQNLRGWFARALFEPDAAEVSATWADGTVALLRHRLGKGAAVRAGTHLFQRYFSASDPATLGWLRDLLVEALPARPRLLVTGGRVRMRRLATAEGDIALLINTGSAAESARIRRPDGSEHRVVVPARDGLLVTAAQLAGPAPVRALAAAS